MNDLIDKLDDESAVRILSTLANVRARQGDCEPTLTPEVRTALQEKLELDPATEPPVSATEGDLARRSLCLFAATADTKEQEALSSLIQSDTPAKMDSITMVAAVTAAWILLQTSVKIKRNTEGKYEIEIVKESTPVKVLKDVVEMLVRLFP